jgi:Caenorhabditis protein of unknown function, DUF268
MKDFIPPILNRIYRKLRIAAVYPGYRQYIAGIGPSHPLHGIPTRLVGDAAADPTEYFDHYDAFSFWAARKIFARGGKLKVLDIGSRKMMNGILSAIHDVTSLVLADCGDRISSVHYIRHDVCDKLPFPENMFDVFTSTVTLPLAGLARYGDRLDPNCLVNLVAELGRVTKPDADLLVSMALGKNVLNFNNTWFFEISTMERIFSGWTITDHLVDKMPGAGASSVASSDRYTKDTTVEGMKLGDTRVVFLHFRRQQSSATDRA